MVSTLIGISSGAVLGALSRHYLSTWVMKILSPAGGFPWGIMVVNILGCFAMGIIVEALALKYSLSNEVRAFLTVGFLGSFTTFSSFALDFSLLVERGQFLNAFGYVSFSVLLSIGALFLGLYIVRMLLSV